MALAVIPFAPTPAPDAPVLLVLRALGLGDFLTGVPALRGLARAFPGHQLVLACPRPYTPLAALTGAVHAVLDHDCVRRVRPVPWQAPPPSVAVNLHGAGPHSHRALRALRPRRLLAFASPELGYRDGPSYAADEHEVERWCRLLGYFGVAADPADLQLARPAARSPAPGAVVVHPGASAVVRRWPPDRFAEVIRTLRAHGRQVVLTGAASERGLAEQVAAEAGLPAAAVLAGRTNMVGLAALIAEAGLVVSGDTGVGHLASAYRRPSVLLFGPVLPRHWGPPAGPHLVLRGQGDGIGPGGVSQALLDVQPREVVRAAELLLSRG